MRILGLSISRSGIDISLQKKELPPGTQTVESHRGWFPLIREAFAGAWQRNIVLAREDILLHTVVFACLRLISSDIGKCRLGLVEYDEKNDVWTTTKNAAHSPVLRKPNRYQIRIKFLQQWIISKLTHGNTYILKARDDRNVVTALYILDPSRVKVLVTADGGVYYRLSPDNLAQVEDEVVVPASEIIHDVHVPLYGHPLVGVGAIAACALSATAGLHMQRTSSIFFGNGALPSGIISWPEELLPEQEKAIQDRWHAEFSGPVNVGKVAVLGLGVKFEPLTMTAVNAQLIDQLRFTSENICTAFGVPAYKVGVGPPPSHNNVEALDQQYYQQCLQELMECIEALLDEGLALPSPLGTELDRDDLIKMDTRSRISAAKEAVAAGMAPNEARHRFMDLGPVKGGETPFLQEQNWPITLLAERELPERPPTPPADTTPPNEPKPEPTSEKGLGAAIYAAAYLSGFEEEETAA